MKRPTDPLRGRKAGVTRLKIILFFILLVSSVCRAQLSEPARWAAAAAMRVSPLTYVHAGNPPVLTVHGDADPVVPYSQAVRLHQALTQAGVKNELVTVHGGGHGGFTSEEMQEAFTKINAFLRAQGVVR